MKKAAYVPPILMSFHAAPSFARPGSVKVPSARPGVIERPPRFGLRAMEPPAGPSSDANSSDANSRAAAQDGGASTSGAGICDGGDVRSFCGTEAGSRFARDAGGQSQTSSIGDLGDVIGSESDVGVMRALFGRLWKSRA